jgi:hypothetical protein
VIGTEDSLARYLELSGQLGNVGWHTIRRGLDTILIGGNGTYEHVKVCDHNRNGAQINKPIEYLQRAVVDSHVCKAANAQTEDQSW